MPTESTSSVGIWWRTGAALALVALSAWLGRSLAERRMVADSMTMTGASASAGDGMNGSQSFDSDHRSHPSHDLSAAALSDDQVHRHASRLAKLWKESPYPEMDFELDAEIDRELANLPSDALGRIFAEFPSAANMDWFMRREITSVWQEKDPAGALVALATSKDSKGVRQILTVGPYREWMLRDPKAAMAWLQSPDLPPMLAENGKMMRLNTLADVAKTQPDFVFEQISSMDREEAFSNLRFLIADRDGITDEVRARALKLAEEQATPEQLAQLRSRQAESMAATDPAAAREMAASLDLPPDKALDLDARIAMASNKGTKGDALNDWLSSHADSTQVPQAISTGISAWMAQDRDAAAQWLDSLPASAQRDEVYAKCVRHYLGFGDPSQAAQLLDRIDSPEARTEALTTLDRLWPLSQPEAAAKWKAGLSQADQALLSGKP